MSTLCQSRKRGHNAIEKKYRTNLNAKIELLREGVPSICGSNGGNLEEILMVKATASLASKSMGKRLS